MKRTSPAKSVATALDYEDEVLTSLALPLRKLDILSGVGSGLTRRPGDPEGTFWAVGDRGPNLKVKVAIERYGLGNLDAYADIDGTKVMPCPEIGPAISQLRLDGDRVVHVRTLPLRDGQGSPISGFAPPGDASTVVEPMLTLHGETIPADPSGADTEGIAALPDGTFMVADEYAPSLLHVAADGEVLSRWVPSGSEPLFDGAGYPIRGALPAIAAKRRLNRGFEGLACSADGASLYLAFQSPLSHPDDAAHRRARHVRLWQLDTATGQVTAQFIYPLDRPSSFRRDTALGDVDRSDIKISELAVIGDDRLLVLERASATTKLYAVRLDPRYAIGPEHLDLDTRPTIEELSASGEIEDRLRMLDKTLILNTDDLPEIDADLEGLIVLSPQTLLLVNDNDFGVEGARTRFWRIDLAKGETGRNA